jgi:hypothetical protein
MSRTPQVILTLNPAGQIVAELPGPSGSRRHLAINDLDTVHRILASQLKSEPQTIGLDGAPTSGQAIHWEKHMDGDVIVSEDEQCSWCIAARMGIDTSEAAYQRAKRELRRSKNRGPYIYSTTAGDGSVRVRIAPTKSNRIKPRQVAVSLSSLFEEE